MSRKRTTLLVSALGLLAVPTTSFAADYCVPTAAACSGGGTAVATLEQAIDLAEASAEADRILLDSGTFTAPSGAGFVYDVGTFSEVEIIGKGSSGAGRTTITAPAAAANVLNLDGAPGSQLADVEIHVPQDFAANVSALITREPARRVAVTHHATQSNPYIAVRVGDDGSFEDGSVVAPATFGQMGIMVFGNDTRVVRSRVQASQGIYVTASASVEVDRSEIVAGPDGFGFSANAARPVRLANSSIRTTGATDAVTAYAQTGYPVEIEAENLTVVGDGTAGAVGLRVSSTVDDGASIDLRSSIVSGYPGGRVRSATGAGQASITASFSNFDPAPGSETGPGALSPPLGALGPGGNMNADPLFTAPGATPPDYTLQAGSSLLDRGDPAATNGVDLAGNPLLSDGDGDCAPRRDIGAFERQVALSPSCSPAPDPGPSGNPDEPGPGAPPGGGDPGPGGSPQPLDTTAPGLTGLRLSRTATRARGGTLRFTLSEAATVEVSLRRRGSRRTIRLRLRGRAGRNALRIRSRRLRPGRHTVTVVAVDAAGNRSSPQRRRISVR